MSTIKLIIYVEKIFTHDDKQKNTHASNSYCHLKLLFSFRLPAFASIFGGF